MYRCVCIHTHTHKYIHIHTYVLHNGEGLERLSILQEVFSLCEYGESSMAGVMENTERVGGKVGSVRKHKERR